MNNKEVITDEDTNKLGEITLTSDQFIQLANTLDVFIEKQKHFSDEKHKFCSDFFGYLCANNVKFKKLN